MAGTATVAVVDRVEVGQQIVKSGNTGDSSTPHLHFDVRSGWGQACSGCNLSEMPSVKIHFYDRTHVCWIPRAGETPAPADP